MALALVLGLAQCKKEEMPASNQVEGISITLDVNSGASSGSKVNVDPNGHHDPDYATVTFETGDTIFVGNNGQYCGFLIYNGSKFTGSIDDTNLSGSDYLHFYFLGGLGFRPTVDGNTATVNISNQTEKYPVISYAHSTELFSSERQSYKAKLQNKVSIMKFNVTTPSSSAICITGMNNKVNVDFTTPNGTDNGFSYEKQGTGEIKMKGQAGSGEKTYWAIVLPTEAAIPAGDEGSVFTYDGYKGTRSAIAQISANQYLSDGVAMTVNTLDMRYAALTFEAETAGATVTFSKGSGFSGTVQYSTDGGSTWFDYSSAITLASVGHKVMFRGDNSAYYNGSAKFSCDADCYIYGNIMSLVSSTSYPTVTSVSNYAFREIFKSNTHIKSHDTKNLILPATTLGGNCYQYMFQYCSGLTKPPVILATTLSGGSCCGGMFEGCTGLTSVPEMHVTQLSNYCCQKMFKDCTSLTTIPANLLPATTLARGCYENMFEGCTGLTNVPNLPATALSERCYYSMFKGCTSLTTVPAGLLPATSLANVNESKGCYESMFQDCTGLTSVPNLPATVLKERCYMNMFRKTALVTVPTNMLSATTMAKQSCESMFRECPNLTNTPTIVATILAEACCNAMFYHSSNITSASSLPATTLVTNCYNNLFSGCSKLSSITCYATDISADGCTTNWLNGVAATGTFTKAASMSSWTTGASGIPSGWTVVDAQ